MGVGELRGRGALIAAAVTQPKVDRPKDGDGDAGDAAKAQATPAPGSGLAVNKTA
jgi:hypothetical protein